MYYCKNCGEPYVTDEAVICVKCGTEKGKGTNFCSYCGKPLEPQASVCLNCGVSAVSTNKELKSKLAAGLFGIFFGAFGVHNFYLGYTGKAVVQLCVSILGLLLSCLVIGVFVVLGIEIWGFVEGVMILTGKIDRDAKGNLLRD